MGFSIAIVAILGWVAVSIAGIVSRNRVHELHVRERIAMIEKGLVPPPEVDPVGFERRFDRMDLDLYRGYDVGRHRRAGMVLIGVGVGFMFLVGAGERSLRALGGAIGIGGFIIVLGVTFLLVSLFEGRVASSHHGPPPSQPPTERGPSQPGGPA